MASKVFDLESARAAGDEGASVVVSAQTLVIKRVESPVTLIIVRDNNDRVSIAAGETRTLKAGDCRALGEVLIENEEGTGELELYWSSLICMSADSGKAEAAALASAIGGGAYESLLYHYDPNAGAITTGPLIITGVAGHITGHTIGTGAPGTISTQQARLASINSYGWIATGNNGAGPGGTAGVQQRVRFADVLDPARGGGYVRYAREMYFSGANVEAGGAGFLVGARVGSLGAFAGQPALQASGLGFITVAEFWRAVYADESGVVLINEPTGVPSDVDKAFLEILVGRSEDLEPVYQWRINGVVVHEVRGALPGVLPIVPSRENGMIAGCAVLFDTGGVGSFECLIASGEYGIRMYTSTEPL